ncbi:hypothetical protein [Phaeobacter gallaeciensis]|uniref:hypothetical protein n=1 Tax=Phaeobacter gallaeciensis TaxID=60890 RepID=UPI000BBB9286|nr:hypothetical protein [Phaeobacter gallaeciensis]ATF18670.1 hypothetical protein PhaeoP129_02046 [Phaeobacter gallaeciensis]ATF22779.1 hypothetical protein PhaeoP128_02046 [Phaeobacter gallaeciensis]
MTSDNGKIDNLMQQAQGLERRILAAHRQDRLVLYSEFSRTLTRLRVAGGRVPSRMQRLEQMLGEEAAEEMFDNMPV